MVLQTKAILLDCFPWMWQKLVRSLHLREARIQLQRQRSTHPYPIKLTVVNTSQSHLCSPLWRWQVRSTTMTITSFLTTLNVREQALFSPTLVMLFTPFMRQAIGQATPHLHLSLPILCIKFTASRIDTTPASQPRIAHARQNNKTTSSPTRHLTARAEKLFMILPPFFRAYDSLRWRSGKPSQPAALSVGRAGLSTAKCFPFRFTMTQASVPPLHCVRYVDWGLAGKDAMPSRFAWAAVANCACHFFQRHHARKTFRARLNWIFAVQSTTIAGMFPEGLGPCRLTLLPQEVFMSPVLCPWRSNRKHSHRNHFGLR